MKKRDILRKKRGREDDNREAYSKGEKYRNGAVGREESEGE